MESPHVGEAESAVLLPGTTLRETYLSPGALVRAAVRAGADALHPGYGFLSEDPALAEACAQAGITWVGPPPEAMRVMGHKARAKEVVAGAGVPVLPSAVVPAGASSDELAGSVGAIGYPLLVKASAGGGGRGCGSCANAGQLADAVASAQREAQAAFGSDEVFLERYLAIPAMSRSRWWGTPTARCCTCSTVSARCNAGTRRSSRRRPPSWWRRRPAGRCGTRPSPRRRRSPTSASARWSTWSTRTGSTSWR